MSKSKDIVIFLEFIKAGLWDTEPRLSVSEDINWKEIYNIACEQSVPGLFLSGLEHAHTKPSQVLLLPWIGEIQSMAKKNKAMNEFIAGLLERLREASLYVLLVKGQGIAQCYEKPLWRACGDVDLFLDEDNYKKAVPLLSEMAQSIDEENEGTRHLAMNINGWPVELHGTLRSGLWRHLDSEIDKVQEQVFREGLVRRWMNGRTQVLLPAANEDLVFVFTHILQHFFKEGIGLRQICDWCRLLWTHREEIDRGVLAKRLLAMGIMTEWKAFAALAVDYLGMPMEAMPLYDSSAKWSRKASKVMRFVLETGNFGYNRDYSYQRRYPFVVRKAISAWLHLVDFWSYFAIFPLDAAKVTWNRMCWGFSVAARGDLRRG